MARLRQSPANPGGFAIFKGVDICQSIVLTYRMVSVWGKFRTPRRLRRMHGSRAPERLSLGSGQDRRVPSRGYEVDLGSRG